MMYQLFLLILGVSGVYSDSHSVRHYYSMVSGPGWGMPEYTEVGYVDDQQFVTYNSESGIVRPVARWMSNVDPNYWEERTQVCKGNEAVFRHNVKIAMSRFNQTGGLHSVQVLRGCELRDDGSMVGFEQLAYDGRDFLYLDTQRGVYIPTMYEAQISTQRWNSPDVRMGERKKIYLEKICIEWLKKYVNFGRDDLEKRVPPDVKVFGQKSVGVTKLHCWVYGFHPRAVDVKWMKNEQDEVPLDEAQPILPNPDGTYQIRVTVEVAVGEEDSYSCHVDHSSLEETLIMKWEPKSGLTIGLIIGVVFSFLVVVVGIAGFLTYKKITSTYETTNS
ncbi:class I histocompatibility antigen, F10 alpha chain-like [Mixophyes fleayi]|uniref:class I histocompatibility antigen, F10 alpha chain-like n=1 Tax=Mixophyes fleayi TaxID=3061075 RepID=UPI003F4DA954